MTDSAIGTESLFGPKAVEIGASASRTLLDDGTRLQLFDGGQAAGSLTPPKYGVERRSR